MPTADSALFVCSVGGSPAPVVFSLCQHRPQYVLFVCSTSSLPSVETQILPALNFRPEWNILLLTDEQDLLSCVRDIRFGVNNILDSRKRPTSSPLLADFTGGTKVMSAALVMALMEQNVQFTYVGGGTRTKNGLGTVQEGEERIMHLANPWQVLATAHIQDFVMAFNSCQFFQAEKIARFIAERRHPVFFTSLAGLSQAYALWDGFHYAEARQIFAQYLPMLEQETVPMMKTCIEMIKINNLALQAVSDELDAYRNNRQPCPRYLHDLVANALRREKQGRYDDAVARLYSVLEKMAKITLYCDYNLDTSALTTESLPQSFLNETQPVRGHDGTLQLPLFRSYQLLATLHHPLGLRFMTHKEQLERLLQARNHSLLAHGFEPVSGETCTELGNLVMAFLHISKKELPEFPTLSPAMF